jgi:hypothetical protein
VLLTPRSHFRHPNLSDEASRFLTALEGTTSENVSNQTELNLENKLPHRRHDCQPKSYNLIIVEGIPVEERFCYKGSATLHPRTLFALPRRSLRAHPVTISHYFAWSWRRDLNPRPSDYKSDALPTELRQRISLPYEPVTEFWLPSYWSKQGVRDKNERLAQTAISVQAAGPSHWKHDTSQDRRMGKIGRIRQKGRF